MNVEELAAAYVGFDPEHYRNEVQRLLAEEPEEGWRFIEAAIEAAKSTNDLASVGAGPLEALMEMWGAAFADRLIDKVRGDVRWAYATSIVQGAAGAEEAHAAIASIWTDLDSITAARLSGPVQ
jgi:hypothetical protein